MKLRSTSAVSKTLLNGLSSCSIRIMAKLASSNMIYIITFDSINHHDLLDDVLIIMHFSFLKNSDPFFSYPKKITLRYFMSC